MSVQLKGNITVSRTDVEDEQFIIAASAFSYEDKSSVPLGEGDYQHNYLFKYFGEDFEIEATVSCFNESAEADSTDSIGPIEIVDDQLYGELLERAQLDG